MDGGSDAGDIFAKWCADSIALCRKKRRWLCQYSNQLEELFDNSRRAWQRRASSSDAPATGRRKQPRKQLRGWLAPVVGSTPRQAAAPHNLFVGKWSNNPPPYASIRAVWASWAFLLRAQSEFPPSVRQLPSEKAGEDWDFNAPAVVGTWGGHLAIKLRGRKHTRRGSRMVRKCIRAKHPAKSLEIYVPQLARAVCSFRENVRRRVRAG